MGIQSFGDTGTEDVFHGRRTKAARKVCPDNILHIAVRKLDQLNQAANLNDLRVPPANHLEKLWGDRAGMHSIRITLQWRICFRWTDAGPESVQIIDYHH